MFTGKKNKLRVYYLSWLRNRILHNDPEVEKKQGWVTVGDLEGCIHYKVGKSSISSRVVQKYKSIDINASEISQSSIPSWIPTSCKVATNIQIKLLYLSINYIDTVA